MTAAATTVYLFAGDSLTEGIYGESYVERVARGLYHGWAGLEGEVVNAGRGGDTVLALLERIDGLLRDHRPDWVILAVGGNDVWIPWLSSHSPGWRLWFLYRRFRAGPKPATDLDHFAAAYRALIDRARQGDARVLACTVSPLGERLSSPLNRRLARVNGVIKHVAAECQVPVADVWQAFVEELATIPNPSGYLPGEWLFAWLDRQRLKKSSPDEIGRRRRLHLTLDGVHLNSRGAELWANTVLNALAQARFTGKAAPHGLARPLALPCFEQAALEVCCTPGWEARARDLASLLGGAYDRLATLTEARPAVRLAVLDRVHWNHLASPLAYPDPAARWEGRSGTLFVPAVYDEPFLRRFHLPQVVADWSSWPPALAGVGEAARVTALADRLVVQELARLFLHELRVVLSDPAMNDLLAAYLAQVAIHAWQGAGAAEMAGLWDAWTEVLARAGGPGGQARLRARTLYEARGEDLVAALTRRTPAVEEQVVRSFVEIE